MSDATGAQEAAPSGLLPRVSHYINYAIGLLLGLFVVLPLESLRAIAALVLIGVIVQARHLNRPSLGRMRLWVLQFIVFFLCNALLFAPLVGTSEHWKGVALESWSTTLVFFGLLLLYLDADRLCHRALDRAFRVWMPLGLVISFAIMSYFYFSDAQGARAKAFSISALGPPLWFLMLTAVSFSGFARLTTPEKALRFVLLGLSAVMALYAGARMVMALWCIAAFLLIFMTFAGQSLRGRLVALVGAGGLLVLMLVGVYVIDQMSYGIMWVRFQQAMTVVTGYADLSEGERSIHFLRLELWSNAWAAVREAPLFGYGQINERVMVDVKTPTGFPLRAHQTYLSYLLAGGVLALISGLIFQAAVFAMKITQNGFARGPLVVGLCIVPALNGLTDSAFQSVVTVQFLAIVLLLLERMLLKPDSR